MNKSVKPKKLKKAEKNAMKKHLKLKNNVCRLRDTYYFTGTK